MPTNDKPKLTKQTMISILEELRLQARKEREYAVSVGDKTMEMFSAGEISACVQLTKLLTKNFE